MFRPLLAGALAAGLVLAAGLHGSVAQDKKDEKKQPPKKVRIALAEPTEVAKDPDFAIQGEYEGTLTADKENGKVGVQVIANGLGEFTVKLLKDGLPGAGWDGKTSKRFTATTGNARVAILNEKKEAVGTIADGKIEIKADGGTLTAKKVERKSKTIGEKPPAGAVVLFAGEGDEKNWNGGKIKALSDGKYLDVGVTSKQKFGAFKAHIEFRLPWMPNSTGQGRGNSGVYFQDRYECQVLDSFGLNGENNECGGIYTQHKPSVNMCLPPLVWQTYDIEFTPAEFGADGKKTKNARATVFHNGVKIHDNIEFPKECPGGKKEEATPGPFQFQNHSDPVVYRNVWVVEVK
ncbi:MAG: DUF1080 domain-containing protein [Planctomycetes bacterium]|nr:DUF1080 domain-containing protein [Planctomycetota bacterium]